MSKAKYIQRTRVYYEPHINKREITQCKQCQEWSDATANCFLGVTRCVKCAGSHRSYECGKSREEPATCCNCGGDHPASSMDCNCYNKAVEAKQRRNTQAAISAQTRKPKYQPAPAVLLLNETRTSATYKIRLRGFITEHLILNGVNGGVAVLLRNDVPYKRIMIRTPTLRRTEAIAIQFADGTVLVAVYNSPQKKLTTEELTALFSLGDTVILAGEFMATHTHWNCNRNNVNGNMRYKFINDHNDAT